MPTAYAYLREPLPWESSVESQMRSINSGYDELELKCKRKKVTDTANSRTVPLVDRPRGRLLFDRPERGDLIISSNAMILFGSSDDLHDSLSKWDIMGIQLVLVDDQVWGVDDRARRVLWCYKKLDDARHSETARIALANCKAAGKPVNQYAPLGFKWKKVDGISALAADREERKTMAKIVELREAGETWEAIYWKFSKEGRKNKHGKEWSMTRIRRAYDAEIALRKEEAQKKKPQPALAESE